MSGKLYLCATPIGNLEDITLRVLRTLKEVDLIAAEDTRNSIKLLNHFEIKTPMTSYHEYNKIDKAYTLIEKMQSGMNIALITDAGTPGISDPGEELAAMCYDAGIEDFYAVENAVDGKFFVTARGWEDLSRLLQSYEKLGIGISEELVEEFLQKEETARDFAGFYQLYTKYGEDYEIPSILSGNLSRENLALKEKIAADGAFEERFAVVNLILGALREKAEEYGQADHQLEILYEMLLHLRTQVRKNAEEEKLGISLLEEFVQEQENSLQIKVKMELISVREQKYQETAIRRLREYILTAKKEHVRSAENGFKRISKCFEKEAVCREDMIQKLQGELQNAFSFIKESFGENQEMLLFVTGITADKSMTSFIAGNGCPAYFEHSEMLLYNKEENELRKACLEAGWLSHSLCQTQATCASH